MRKVYIASPYTIGDVAVNVHTQIMTAAVLIKNGFAPYAPLMSHFQHMMYPEPYETWLKLDMEWLLSCDCVLRLPGESHGADMEVKLANDNYIDVFYDINELIETRE